MTETHDNGASTVNTITEIDTMTLAVTGMAEAVSVLDDLLGEDDITDLSDIAADVEESALLEIFDEKAVAQRLRQIRGAKLEEFRMSTSGDADRFASRYGDRVLADQHLKGRDYYVGNRDNLWRMDDDGKIAQMCDKLATEMRARARVLNPNGATRAQPQLSAAERLGIGLAERADKLQSLSGWHAVPMMATDRYGLRVRASRDMDANPALLATPGGQVIELRDDEARVRPLTLADRCTFVTSVPYNPQILDNPPELIRDFIAKFLPEEGRVDKLFTLFGQALRGGNAARLFVFIIGGTTSGKTQLVNAIKKTLGNYVAISPASVFTESKTDKPRPDIIRLYDARITFFAEASRRTWQLQGSRVKLFTGRDQDPQRGMRSDYFHEKEPQCMPVIYANDMPKIIGMDKASERRCIVIPMDHTLPKEQEDTSIREQFRESEEVRMWLLAKLVEGYVRSIGKGGLATVMDEFSLTTKTRLGDMYMLADFLSTLQGGDNPKLTYTPPGPDGKWPRGTGSRWVTKTDLFAAYSGWVEMYGGRHDRLEKLGMKDFCAELRDNHGFIDVKSGDHRWGGWELDNRINISTMRSFAATSN